MIIHRHFTKYTFLFFLLANYLSVSAQENVKLPDILPPSPSAFALTRYGGITLGLQTGTAQYSIPIYTLSSGKLSIPISLSYSSNGVKVDELASRVGTSWIINAGGVITRTVYDQPDEKSTRLSPPATFEHTQALYAFLDQAIKTDRNGLDITPDVFSFNFNGYSGQFILDGSRVVQLTKSNLKIELNQSDQADFGGKFRITTPDGVIYYFGGGANSSESSYSSSIGESCGKSFANPIDNAWYLTKVQNPQGDNLVLEYGALSPYSYPASISESRTKSLIGFQRCFLSGEAVTIDDTNCENLITTNSVYLTKITASNGNNIVFNYTDRQDLVYDKLLSSFDVFQYGNSSYLKSFRLTYNYAQSTSFFNSYSQDNPKLGIRPFLTSVTEMGTGINEKHIFSFEYNNISNLPPRLSYAQDDYGYFNGALNHGLIPQPSAPLAPFFPDASADRSSKFDYAQIGTLQKITYPTGGYDLISYKAPDYRVTELPDPISLSQNVTGVGTGLSTPVTSTSQPFTITKTQGSVIKSAFTFIGTPGQEDFHQQVTIEVVSTGNGQTVYTGLVNAGNPQLTETVNLTAGISYFLRCTANGQYSRGDASLFYYTQGTTPIEKTKITGGVVVDFVKTYDPVANNTSIKKYFYANLTDLTKSSGSVVLIPIYSSDYTTSRHCLPTRELCGEIFQFRTMSSNSMTNLYAYNQHHIYYQNVVESFGANFENGGIEHTYTVEANTPGEVVMGNDILSSPLTNRGVGKNGLETFTNVFKKNGTVFQSVKQTTTTYKDDNRLSELLYGYTVRKRYDVFCITSPPSEEMFNAFDVKRNYMFSRWVYPDTVVTTSFDLFGANKLVQTEVTKYDNTTHLLPTQKIVTKSNGKNWLTQFKYSADFASVSPYDQMYNTLHIWSPIVEQLEYQINPADNTTTFIQSTKTDFQIWNGNNSQIYPVTVSTKTGSNNYDARIQFQGYDTKGNIQSVSKVNGPPICYIYSYGGTYPVAQISNVDYNTVVTILGGVSAVQTFRDNLNPTDDAVNSFLMPLRTNTALKRAQVITYTYKPLIGVTTMTDSKGMTTTYLYDNFQRLTDIKDKDGNIVKHMDYHYQGQ